ncbi:hypothetical protein [Tritonibacter mobilis]|uniref:hypothetical protein n=1 Tax=Tritonibacter mobilis TaxID=379347 RepID=UPI000A755FFB|nr:hypothetical protein [Tritonibacter mobilis]
MKIETICDELNIAPRGARERLRATASSAKANPELAKARKPRTQWQWVKGATAYKEAVSTRKKWHNCDQACCSDCPFAAKNIK